MLSVKFQLQREAEVGVHSHVLAAMVTRSCAIDLAGPVRAVDDSIFACVSRITVLATHDFELRTCHSWVVPRYLDTIASFVFTNILHLR